MDSLQLLEFREARYTVDSRFSAARFGVPFPGRIERPGGGVDLAGVAGAAYVNSGRERRAAEQRSDRRAI
jgi:hypothetical protein